MTPPPTYPEATAYSPMGRNVDTIGYLKPRTSAEIAAELNAREDQNGFPEQYILPTAERNDSYDLGLQMRRGHHHSNSRDSDDQRSSNFRMTRLRSASCEEINATYSGGRIGKERKGSKDHNENDRPYDLAKPQPPFKNLHDFRGSLEMLCGDQRSSMEYYNINGLKGTVDDSPAPTVYEARKRFNDGAKPDSLTRSISNPNFFNIQTKEKLIDARSSPSKSSTLESQTLNGKRKSKSLLNLFKKSSRDKSGNRTSDRISVGGSTPSSPSGTLTRQTSIPMISIGGSQVFITERTRSFRRPKSKPGDQSESSPSSNRSSYSSNASKSPNTDAARNTSRQSSTSSSSKSPMVQRHELTKRQDSATSLPLNLGQGQTGGRISGNLYTDNRLPYNTHSLDRSGAHNSRYPPQATLSPPLPKRDRSSSDRSSSSSYANIVHSRSSSDGISSRVTGPEMQTCVVCQQYEGSRNCVLICFLINLKKFQ